MAYSFGTKSRERLVGVHPDIVKVAHQAITSTTVDSCILEGVRTMERQRLLFQAGASQTLNSRHLLALPRDDHLHFNLGPVGHALDIGAWVDHMVRWDWPLYYMLANAMKMAAMEVGIPIEWGGDWTTSFKDGPHYQLPRKTHPV